MPDAFRQLTITEYPRFRAAELKLAAQRLDAEARFLECFGRWNACRRGPCDVVSRPEWRKVELTWSPCIPPGQSSRMPARAGVASDRFSIARHRRKRQARRSAPWRAAGSRQPKWARLPLGHDSLSSYMTQSPSSHQVGPLSSLTTG
jgi:hypothetical protein